MVLNKRTACAGLLLLAALFLLTFVADNSEADVIDVDSLGEYDYTNITQAVENATAGDTVIYPGLIQLFFLPEYLNK